MRKAGRKLPGRWLFTDERLGGERGSDPLWKALARLPRGSGVIFRHYGLTEAERQRLFLRVRQVAARRGLLLLASGLSGAPHGSHRPGRSNHRGEAGIRSASAHDRRELLEAFRGGADLVFLSPVFPTRSHPGAPTLGPVRFGLAARGATGPVLALGGMDERRARRLAPLGAAGFGGIDCWA